MNKLDAINTQLKMDKENLMRERDDIMNNIQESNKHKAQINELRALLEEEKKQRRIDAINFDELQNSVRMEYEQENLALRETVKKLNKNLELGRVDDMKGDHNKRIIEDLRYKIRGLINENEKLKMECSYKDSKIQVSFFGLMFNLGVSELR